MSQLASGFDRVRWQRAAADPRSAACALGFGSIVALGFSDGGYYDGTWHRAGLALGAVAGIGLLLGRGATPGRLELLSLSALAGLAMLTLLSAGWGIAGTEAVREAERCALYVVGLAALLLVARPCTTQALLNGVIGGIVTLAAFALVDRVTSAPTLDPYQGALLKEPVGYANALGLLMAIGVVLALGLLPDTDGIRRAALTAAAATCAVALMLTSSRGAWLSAAVGLVVVAALRCRRPALVAAIASAGVVLLLAAPRVSLGDRPAYWNVALADASEHVVLGSGAGSFDDYWLEHRPIPAYVRDAHSLYLETAAELGIVGLAFLLVALGTPLAAAVRTRENRIVTTAAAAYVAFLVHAGLDWDWEMPVTTFAGLACGAALLVSARDLSSS
jgi:hypothetical protein